jgi:hypothetical protein
VIEIQDRTSRRGGYAIWKRNIKSSNTFGIAHQVCCSTMNSNTARVFLCLATIHFSDVCSQIQREFPNLFRGSRSSQNGDDSNLIAIQPLSSFDHDVDYLKEGAIQISSDIWNKEEVNVQLFPHGDGSSWLKFRQSSMDQPTPNTFYGTLDVNDDGITDFISLVKTTVTSSHIPVVVGNVHVNGTLYQIRQLPNGELIVDNRGTADDFDDEIEIEDANAGEWEATEQSEEGEIDELELDFPLDRRRRAVAVANDSNVSTIISADRSLQSIPDDGSTLDILVRLIDSVLDD